MTTADLTVKLKAEDSRLKKAVHDAILGAKSIQAAYQKSNSSIKAVTRSRDVAFKQLETSMARIKAAERAQTMAIDRYDEAYDKRQTRKMGAAKRQIALTDRLITKEKIKLALIRKHYLAYEKLLGIYGRATATQAAPGLLGAAPGTLKTPSGGVIVNATDEQKKMATALQSTNRKLADQTARAGMAEAQLHKLQGATKKTSRSQGILNNKFAKFSIYMSGIAATLFVIQQVGAIARAVVAPILEIEEAMISIKKLGSDSGFLPQQTIARNPMDADGYYKGWEARWEILPNQINAEYELQKLQSTGMITTEEAAKAMIEYSEAGYTAAEAIRKVSTETLDMQKLYEGTLSGEFKEFVANMKGLSLLTFEKMGGSFKAALARINDALNDVVDPEKRAISEIKTNRLNDQWNNHRLSSLRGRTKNRKEIQAETRRLGRGYDAIGNYPDRSREHAADQRVQNEELAAKAVTNAFKIMEKNEKRNFFLKGLDKEIADVTSEMNEWKGALRLVGRSTAKIDKIQNQLIENIKFDDALKKANSEGFSNEAKTVFRGSAKGRFVDDYAIDSGGIDKIQAAMDMANLKQNNLNLAIGKSIELQNAMAGAIEDTYDVDNGVDSYTLEIQKQQDEFGKLEKSAEKTVGVMEEAFTGWATSYSSTLTDLIWENELTFGKIAESFGRMLTQMVLQQQMSELMGGLFSLSPSAKGNTFSGAGISAYSNKVVNSPTLFPFAKGIGLMGEAGSEAIMPLTRTKDGDLGVKAETSKINVIINEAPPGTTVTQNKNGDMTDIVINLAAGSVASHGPLAKAIENTYGLKRPGRRA